MKCLSAGVFFAVLASSSVSVGQTASENLPPRVEMSKGSIPTDEQHLDASAPPSAPPKKRAVYAVPFLLRPAIAVDIFRVESTVAFQDKATSLVSMFTGGYKPFSELKDLGFYGKVALPYHLPEGASNGVGVSNPLLFASWTPEVVEHVRVAMFLGSTLPVGTGGGNDASTTDRSAMASGIYARQAMDNALFAVNFWTVSAGIGVAYIDHGLTLQADTTLLQLTRTRGSALEKDDARTNFTMGLHAGYLVFDALTLSAELHHQRWLTTPAAVAANHDFRDETTVGVGARANFQLPGGTWIRPGIGYFHPLDNPMSQAGYRIVQLDVPIVFQ